MISQINALPKILKIIRLHIVAGGALAFTVGALLAFVEGGIFRPEIIALGYTVVLLGDLSAHFSNDYFDVEVDKKMNSNKFYSGSKILTKNPQLHKIARNISVTLLLSSTLIAGLTVLFLKAPIELFLIMLFANLLGWFYSAPPLRLISRGLGEITVAWVTGFVIPGVGYLTVRGQFDPLFLYFSIPFMIYGFILSLSLQTPDVKVDSETGKKTLAVRKGNKVATLLTLILTITASSLFLVYNWQNISTLIDLRFLVLLSIIPLTATIFGALTFYKKKTTNTSSTLNITSLFIFNVLLIIFFAIF